MWRNVGFDFGFFSEDPKQECLSSLIVVIHLNIDSLDSFSLSSCLHKNYLKYY